MAEHSRPPVARDPMPPTALAGIGPLSRGLLPPRFWIGGGLVLAALVYLVMTSMQSSAVYYVTVSELLARDRGAAEQTVRVTGAVVDGSIRRDRSRLEFALTDGTASIPVVHSGSVPDLFGYRTEGAYQDVVVEGRPRSDGAFEARTLIVKHGPAFEATEDERRR
jgi:cytochrome c-type biogenesis protein CcmE